MDILEGPLALQIGAGVVLLVVFYFLWKKVLKRAVLGKGGGSEYVDSLQNDVWIYGVGGHVAEGAPRNADFDMDMDDGGYEGESRASKDRRIRQRMQRQWTHRDKEGNFERRLHRRDDGYRASAPMDSMDRTNFSGMQDADATS